MTGSLHKHEGPNSIPGSYIKTPHTLVCTWNPSTQGEKSMKALELTGQSAWPIWQAQALLRVLWVFRDHYCPVSSGPLGTNKQQAV